MFDIGFWEIAVIGVIALLVIGPERLPAVARNVGRWVGRTRRYVAHVKQDIEREINADEVRQLLEKPDGLESIQDVARETAAVFEDTRKELNSVVDEARTDIQADTQADAQADTVANTQADTGADTAPAHDQATVRRVPHHAVDDDPFASANASSAPLTPPDENTDAVTTSDPSADEQRTEQPEQR